MKCRMAVISMLMLNVLVACNGPTRVGQEMRVEAYSRMDQVNAKIAHEQALSAFETGQLDQARTILAGAIERYPDQADWHTLMGRILLEQHRLDEGRVVLEEALRLDPDSSEAAYYLGVLHERWSKDDRAVEYFAQASEIAPERPQYLLALAEALIAEGRLLEAEARISERMEYIEHHAGLQHLRSQVASLRGDHAMAVKHGESACLLEPRDHAMAYDLAALRFQAGDWRGCLEDLDDLELLGWTPHSGAEKLRVRALMAVGQSIDARTALRAMCQDSPTDPTHWRDLGLLGWDLGDWTSVKMAGDRLSGLDAMPYEAGLFLALAARGQGDPESALLQLESLTRRFPDHPEAWAVLTGVRMRLGDLQGSAEARQMALKWAPGLADAEAVSGVYGTQGP